jgi:hypothetical protein
MRTNSNFEYRRKVGQARPSPVGPCADSAATFPPLARKAESDSSGLCSLYLFRQSSYIRVRDAFRRRSDRTSGCPSTDL